MTRRRFLTELAIGTVGLASAMPAWPTLLRQLSSETHGAYGQHFPTQMKTCKIIGVGGAGCNVVMSDSLQDMLSHNCLNAELRCVDHPATVNRESLMDMVSGAERVVIVSGLGGQTGSSYANLVARSARDAGATTVVMAITPFDWEVQRSRLAQTALKQLRHDADLVLEFSNAEQAIACSDDAPMADIFKRVDQRIAESIVRLLT